MPRFAWPVPMRCRWCGIAVVVGPTAAETLAHPIALDVARFPWFQGDCQLRNAVIGGLQLRQVHRELLL